MVVDFVWVCVCMCICVLLLFSRFTSSTFFFKSLSSVPFKLLFLAHSIPTLCYWLSSLSLPSSTTTTFPSSASHDAECGRLCRTMAQKTTMKKMTTQQRKPKNENSNLKGKCKIWWTEADNSHTKCSEKRNFVRSSCFRFRVRALMIKLIYWI